ncbi:hypothetical protein [uncultured Hyphomicrobium sp.]|uniref:hypothetical protein n=1 Tax=uncultured Hyphomicrobium sp. TaxID=194373 RepID=UPI0025FC9474|nr:hypothetical protein [uncultured Hyphomicrobium sp.]
MSDEAELERLRAENARLIEDRARFPDRPDDVGRIIGAHYGNLKRAKEQADRYAREALERSSRQASELAMVRKTLSDLLTVMGEGGRRGRAIDLVPKKYIERAREAVGPAALPDLENVE